MFGDKAMTMATIDRLVHYATIFEMNVESFPRRTAAEKRQPATLGSGPGRQRSM